MISADLTGLRSILCLGAHADDIEIGCGGTLLRLLGEHAGVSVHWVVLSGNGVRGNEALESAAAFLADAETRTVRIERFPDTRFPYSGAEIKTYFDALGRELRPDVVFTHRLEDRHQDHRLVAELTWNTFRDHLIMEYEIPKYEGDLGTPNVYVPLDAALAERKIGTILRAFATQHAKPWFTAETFRALMCIRGIEANAPSGLAEGLHCRKLIV